MLGLSLRFLQQLHVRYHVGDIADTNHTVPYRKETNGYWHLFSVLTIPEYPQRCFCYIIQNGSFIRHPPCAYGNTVQRLCGIAFTP